MLFKNKLALTVKAYCELQGKPLKKNITDMPRKERHKNHIKFSKKKKAKKKRTKIVTKNRVNKQKIVTNIADINLTVSNNYSKY